MMRSEFKANRKRLWRVIPPVVAVAVLLMLAAFVAWLTFPPVHTPGRVDVVVVMAGATDGRHDIGAQLVKSGVADNLVVSHPLGSRDPAGYRLCAQWEAPDPVETWCMDPLPSTTTGEAQTFELLAARQGWDTAVVVTSRPHHHRVNLNFARCTGVTATVVSIDYLNWRLIPYQVARESGGFLKFWLTRPC